MMAKGTFASINLATPDVDGTFERLQAGDAEVVQEPTDQPYGIRDCSFRILPATCSASRNYAERSSRARRIARSRAIAVSRSHSDGDGLAVRRSDAEE